MEIKEIMDLVLNTEHVFGKDPEKDKQAYEAIKMLEDKYNLDTKIFFNSPENITIFVEENYKNVVPMLMRVLISKNLIITQLTKNYEYLKAVNNHYNK